MEKKKIANVLKILMFTKDMNTLQLARMTNIPQQTLHRIVSGASSNPRMSTLNNIAKFFGITIKQLVGEEVLPERFTIMAEFDDSLTAKPFNIPLLCWEQLNNVKKICQPTENQGINKVEKTITVSPNFNKQCFALIMNDYSMDPYFAKDSILIFDPQKTVTDRGFALVYIKNEQTYIFRQVLFDGQYKYLKPVNPDLNNFKIRVLDESDKIIGTLIETRRMYDPH